MEKKTIDFRIVTVFITLALCGIDQLTKYLAVTYLKPIVYVTLIGTPDLQVLNLTYCENTGMSFSLMEGQRVFLIAVPLILIAVVEWLIFSGKIKGRLALTALAFLAGGGLGNLIDRVLNGYVVDFIDFRIINFAIFNFADICAVLGGICIAVIMIKRDLEEEKAKKEQEKTDTPDENV